MKILINGAGMSLNALLVKSSPDQIITTLNTNLTSAILLSQGLSKSIIRSKGQIINISSVIGMLKQQPGLSIYAASKAGLVGFTKALAKELGPSGVRVNAILPGYIDTDMTKGLSKDRLAIPLGKMGQVEHVAEACMHIVNAEYMTGHAFVLDGGVSL